MARGIGRSRWIPAIFLFALTCIQSIQAIPGCAQDVVEGRLGFREEYPHYEINPQTDKDLNLLSEIYPLLRRTKTAFGHARLRWLLTHPYTDAAYIIERQHAAKALMEESLNVEIAASLERISRIVGSERDSEWLTHLKNHEPDHWLVSYLVAAAARTPFGLAFANNSEYFVLCAFIGTVATVANMTHYEFEREQLENRYRNLFVELRELIPKLRATGSPRLLEIADVLSGLVDPDADPQLAYFNRRLNRMMRRKSLLNVIRYPFEIGMVYSQATVPPVENALVAARDSIFALAGAIGELDALLAVANLARSSSVYQFPHLLHQGAAELEISEGHHPYYFEKVLRNEPNAKSIPNSIWLRALTLGRNVPSVIVLGGSNKGGKSFYERMVALAAIFSQAGLPFPGKVRQSIVQVETRMRITDDETKGQSDFSEDARRDVQIDNLMRRVAGPPILTICDEIARGTKHRQSQIIQMVLLEDWAQTRNLTLIAGHEDALLEFADRFPNVHNYHVEHAFTEEGELTFDYRVRPGVGGPSQRDRYF